MIPNCVSVWPAASLPHWGQRISVPSSRVIFPFLKVMTLQRAMSLFVPYLSLILPVCRCIHLFLVHAYVPWATFILLPGIKVVSVYDNHLRPPPPFQERFFHGSCIILSHDCMYGSIETNMERMCIQHNVEWGRLDADYRRASQYMISLADTRAGKIYH